MIRGTTPTHSFKLPFDTSLIKRVKILYAQCDKLLFHKEAEDCTLSGDTIKTTLSQEETFLFNCKNMVQIQLRVLTHAGDVITSDEMAVPVSKCLDDEVLA